MSGFQRPRGAAIAAALFLAFAPAHADPADDFARGDYEAAYGGWQALAEAGNPEAQLNLAGLYFHGHGVDVDLVEAWKWCELAVNSLDDGDNRLLAVRLRGFVALRMSENELSEARARVAAWEPAD